MRRIIFALLISISSAAALAATTAMPTKPLELAAGAPDRHIVVPGDTLWGLASTFLKDPYRWPELWKLNAEDIKNPHWIYPGQVLTLDRSGAQPRLSIGGTGTGTVKLTPREYITPSTQAIPSIPPTAIEPFLTESVVLDEGALNDAPRIVALGDGRVIAGAGDAIYTTTVPGNSKRWQVFRPAEPLRDPETNEVLGYEAIYLGNASLVQSSGKLTELKMLSSKYEILVGDRIVAAPRADIPTYLPHAPDKMIAGRIIGMPAGVRYAGANTIISINRGKRDGLEQGHVLATETAGVVVADRNSNPGLFQTVEQYQLPDSRNGLLFIFRVFDRVSYALVMNAKRPITIGDVARTP